MNIFMLFCVFLLLILLLYDAVHSYVSVCECVCIITINVQSSSPPEVTVVLHPQESMSAATAYSSISLVVQFTRLYPHEYVCVCVLFDIISLWPLC